MDDIIDNEVFIPLGAENFFISYQADQDMILIYLYI